MFKRQQKSQGIVTKHSNEAPVLRDGI